MRRMTATIHHRGPDDEGVEVRDNVGLGHARLSIIDLSSAGHQPMTNENGTVWIVFNGEIYNFLCLRRELENRHQFRSHSDTEVLLHLYEEEGERLVDRLDGMFAFAIVDLKKQQVLLARDPFGIKPLFYALDDRRLVFGSEIKPLLASGEVTREIDSSALNDYFDFHWIPAPKCIFRQVSKLLPAHTMLLDLGSWEATFRRYWQPQYRPEEGRTIDSWADEAEAVLSKAVVDNMVADVPVGSFLSGGIDSALVSLYASRGGAQPLRTFTIDFKEQGFSEGPYARSVAERIGSQAVFRTLANESVETLDRLVAYYDEPFADSSMLPTFAVSREARKDVTVVLSGDGGDELFSGYLHYKFALALSQADLMPPVFSKVVFGSAERLTPKRLRYKTVFQRLALAPNVRRLSAARLPGRPLHRDVLARELREDVDLRYWHINTYLKDLAGLPPVTQSQFYDLLMYLPNDMLVKVDRASMAHSLEVRVPILSRSVAEFAFRVPESVRFQIANDKRLLRQIVARHFDDELAYRRKAGFGIPLAGWMRQHLAQNGRERILSMNCVKSELFDRAGVEQLLNKVAAGANRWISHHRADELFTLLVFSAWWDKYIQA
jgi:asparagine synthase (glutamine-hydrolysing)